MNWLKENDYIPKWLGILIPFLIFYMQRKKQKARRKPGELPREIDWLTIMFSFFAAISFAILLTPNVESGVRSFALFAFAFSAGAMLKRAKN